MPISNEDDLNITTFVNILLLGQSGAGKSTLINLLLDEMKSLEGGNGFSTTSKKIIVYKKSDYPIRFYDVKGIENQESVDNYYKIMTELNDNDSISHDSINVIFYCIEYNGQGTIIRQMENLLFKKLIKCKIPIFYIITKTSHNPDIKSGGDIDEEYENEREKIENDINSLIKESFKINKAEENDKQKIKENDGQKLENAEIQFENNEQKIKENDGQKLENDEQKLDESQYFIKKYTKIIFVNLVRKRDNPIFGIDKVLSELSKLVPKDNWNELEKAIKSRNVEECKELLKKNIFLRYYSEIDNLNKINQEDAKRYLKNLKAGAFFSGTIPGLDIGMEYYYKKLFKNKLKSLYGFDYKLAKEAVNKRKMEKKSINEANKSQIQNNPKILEDDDDSDNEKGNLYTERGSDKDDKIKNVNIKKEEENIESKINKEIKSGSKNAGSIFRGIFEAGGIAIKTLPESGSIVARASISSGIKVASWALLPITCIGFGVWSVVKVHKDCQKMLKIFQDAFKSLQFQTLSLYLESIKKAIDDLEKLGKTIIEDDKKIEEEIKNSK